MNSPKERARAVAKTFSLLWAVAFAAWCTGVQAAPIHEAAERGDLVQVKSLLEKDPKQIDSTDGKGRTVLACAAASDKKEVAEFLLKRGAVEDGFVAATFDHTKQLAALLRKNPTLANARDGNGKAALHWAAMRGQGMRSPCS